MPANNTTIMSPSPQTQLMDHARSQVSFDPSKLSAIIYGSEEAVTKHAEAFNRVETKLGLLDMSKLPRFYVYNDRNEHIAHGEEAGKACFQDSIEFGHDIFETTGNWSLGNTNRYTYHTAIFIGSLKNEASKEQQHWVKLAESGQIMGTLAQTELSHGTNVRGVETTASFDVETDEFIINSPSTSAAKFWPGSLFTATHAIVMARLLLNNHDHGIHPFLVQVRSLDDNLPLKGVEVGELGVKMGYNGLDNGYATFDHVRIHRMNLLMKHATVTRDGLYAANQHRDQLVYGRMLGGRIHLLLQCAFQFAQATTIAARYSVVRRQGYGPYNKNGPEKTILHYGSQQYRLMSIIAKSYAILFTWQATVPIDKDMLEQLVKNDQSALPHLHALSCGLKAWAAQNSFEGAEEARKMCGGHGYSVMSGLLAITGNLGATCTLEGENWVMWQQTASYLVKGLSASKLPAGMEYLGSYCSDRSDRSDRLAAPCSAHSDDFLSSDTVRKVFEHRAARLIFEVCVMLSSSSLSKAEAWDKYMMSLIQAACAHVELYVLNAFIRIVSNVSDRTIRIPLQDLLILFALTTIITPPAYSPTFFLDNYLSAVQRREILEQIDCLLKRLVPNIIGLTDAWNFSDANLASAIGCYDGNAHERLIRWARQLPINSKNTHVKLLDEVDAKSTGGPAQAKL